MKSLFITRPLHYDGTQLKLQFAYENVGILGDSIVSFLGSCDVPFAHMVDGEDRLSQQTIAGSQMLHFIVEVFHRDLFSAVWMQRLLANIVREQMQSINPSLSIRRSGDDLYWNDGKLSISIATVSALSLLIHFAVNVSNNGTPVKTACLEELNIDAQTLASRVMAAFIEEFKSVMEATQKVRPV